MRVTPTNYNVRPFTPDDEDGWVRCRTLAFLTTQYYDDVKPRRRKLDAPSIGLVATDALGQVFGVLDIEVDGTEATEGLGRAERSHSAHAAGSPLRGMVCAADPQMQMWWSPERGPPHLFHFP